MRNEHRVTAQFQASLFHSATVLFFSYPLFSPPPHVWAGIPCSRDRFGMAWRRGDLRLQLSMLREQGRSGVAGWKFYDVVLQIYPPQGAEPLVSGGPLISWPSQCL